MIFTDSDSMKVQLAFKTWQEVGEYLKKSDSIIVPIGATEQHGPSCPVITDTLIAEHIAIQVGLATDILVAPSIPLGDSLIHLDFPGTIALKPSTLMAVVKDYITSLHGQGFRRFLIVNGHGDNLGPIMAAFSELGNELKSLRYLVKDFWDFQSFRKVMRAAFGDPIGGHADATDASIVMAIDESLVDKELFANGFAKVKYWISRDLVSELYTKNGVINSDQSLASLSIGQDLLKEAIKGYTLLIRQLQSG